MAESKQRARRGGWLALLGDGLLLACALTGALLSFLSLYAHSGMIAASSAPHGGLDLFLLYHSVPQLTALSLFLALLSLAVWSLPRFRGPVLGALAAGWALLVWMVRQDFWDGARLTAKAIADLFEERVGWFGVWELDLGLTAVQELAAVERFLFCAMLLLALLLGWCVVRARRWWLVVLLTLPPLLPGLLADAYPHWPSFLMLCACWCAMLLTDLCKWAAPAGRGKLTLVVLPAVGLLLAALITILPQEGYTRPAWALRAEGALTDLANRYLPTLVTGESPGTPVPAGPTFVGSADRVDLTSAGPLNYTGRTVLQVSAQYTGRIYLRGASLAEYTGSSWEPLDSGAYQSSREQWGSVSPLLFPAILSAGGHSQSITIRNTGASAATAYLPYQLADQEFGQLTAVDDGAFASSYGHSRYTVSFLPGLLDLAAAAPGGSAAAFGAESAYERFVNEHYLQADLSPELEALFDRLLASGWQDPGGEAVHPSMDQRVSSRLARARQVAQVLAQLCEYDPETPLTPAGEDFVEYFLTESRRGYCMHFASAAVLMFRHMGVPARYVSGFAADVSADRTTYVPDSAAHAWAEIYLPGYGWYPVEVTPGYEGGDAPAPSEPLPTESAEPTPSPAPTASAAPSAAPSQAPAAGDAPLPSQAPDDGSGLSLWKLCRRLVPAVLLAAALWLGQFLPKRLRNRRLSAPDTNRAVLDGYRYLTRLKKWGGTVDEAALALARKARFSQHALTEEERRTMADLFDGERSRLSQALPPVKRLAFRYLWGRP